MDKVWLQSYPPGVPEHIDPTQYRSLVQLMEAAFRQYATRPAWVCMGRTLSYAELDALSAKVAAWLQHKGLRKGSRVAIMLPNILPYPVIMAGILRAGLVVVNVNPLYTPRELEHQLNDSGAETIFVLENCATTLEQILAKTKVKQVVVLTMGDLMGSLKGLMVNFVVRHKKKLVPPYSLPNAIRFNQIIAEAAPLTLKNVQLGPDDVAFLQYTGGTTGVAKGAVLLHRNIIANVLQSEAWVQPMFEREPKVEQLVIVCALPLYHIFALATCALMGARLGSLSILIPNPRDLDTFVKDLKPFQVNIFPAVNTLYNSLLNHPGFDRLDFSKLKVCNGGGMAVQSTVAERWLKLTGCPIAEGYGLSETSPGVSMNRLDISAFTGSIGLPLPSTEIAILDDDGQALPLGEAGEIAIRGPQVMAGYWKRDDETAKVMTADGFFRTGDIGTMDQNGYLRIVDRKKDMILVSGFNVYPTEIEAVVAKHGGVLECACIGVPDQHTGEAVKLIVVKKDPQLSVEQLMEFCKAQFTAYKKPKYIEFRDELPKSPVGKILRRALRDKLG